MFQCRETEGNKETGQRAVKEGALRLEGVRPGKGLTSYGLCPSSGYCLGVIKVWFWYISEVAFFLEKAMISSSRSLLFSSSLSFSSWWTLLRCSNLAWSCEARVRFLLRMLCGSTHPRLLALQPCSGCLYSNQADGHMWNCFNSN